MSHRNARLTHAGAYSSSSGFEIRACLLPCRQSDGNLTPMRPSLGAALRRGGFGRTRGPFEPTSSFASAHRRPP